MLNVFKGIVFIEKSMKNLKILQNVSLFVNQDYHDSNAMGYVTSNFIGQLQ
jgi:hypothetical protein